MERESNMNQSTDLLPRKISLRQVLLGTAAAGAVTGLAFFGWSVKAKDAATFHLANGVQVTPVEVHPDDMAQLLDAKIWKFDVALPDRTKWYYYKLTVYKHGKVIGIVGGLETGPSPEESYPRNSPLTIAMMPVGSGNFDAASQAKYIIRTYGVGSEGVFANPIKGCHSYSTESQASPPDNSVSLIDGTETNMRYGEARLNDVSIALSIQPATVTMTK